MNEASSKYYYKESVEDIKHNIECILFFSDWKKRYKHTKLEKYWETTIALLRKEQENLLDLHEDEYDEKIDVKMIEDSLKGIAMRKTRAKDMIKQIVNSGIKLTTAEDDFLVSIYDSMYTTLTDKQASWLQQIYNRVIL